MDLYDDWDWTEWAACRGVDTEPFFPISTQGSALTQIEQAKAICARCPVLDECLEFASRSGQRHGIWGGKTAEERRSRQRYRARAHRVGTIAPTRQAS